MHRQQLHGRGGLDLSAAALAGGRAPAEPRHLAHVNVARFRRPKTDPANAAFLAALDAVNAAAEAWPGLVWRFTASQGDDGDRRIALDPHALVNLSVWTDIESLRVFTYGDPLHRAMMRRRREWFERLDVSLALWWVPSGTRPRLRDGLERLDRIARLGASADAFTFAEPFDAGSLDVEPRDAIVAAALTDGPGMDSSGGIAAPARPGDGSARHGA